MGLRTPLYSWHAKAGAKIVDFGGWDMPVVYSSIIEEHNSTRSSAGLFDISHMGRLRFEGIEAEAFLERILTNRVRDLKVGQARYCLVLNENAGVLDDVLVYRMTDWFLLVVNASNREKLLSWFNREQDGFSVQRTDLTLDWGMIACQGPSAVPLVEGVLGVKISDLDYYHARETSYEQQPAIVSRTGYTGEDGFEIILPVDLTEHLWTALAASGVAKPVGLGARDTLRLEAGMPLYGHELTEELDPVQARLGWAVKGKSADGAPRGFVGKEALADRPSDRPVRVGLQLEGKRIAREGFAAIRFEEKVGYVTSGTFAPTLQSSIAMAYVEPSAAEIGTTLAVNIRGTSVPAVVMPLPFYRREK